MQSEKNSRQQRVKNGIVPVAVFTVYFLFLSGAYHFFLFSLRLHLSLQVVNLFVSIFQYMYMCKCIHLKYNFVKYLKY